jgi:hypothetical protein
MSNDTISLFVLISTFQLVNSIRLKGLRDYIEILQSKLEELSTDENER